MNPEEILAQLHDVYAPDAVSWWPPAPGWWLLSLLLFAVLWVTVRSVVAQRGKNQYRQAALAHLQRLREEARSGADAAIFLARANQLLKRIALQIDSREHVANLSGARWADWLQQRAPESLSDQSLALLSDALYSARPPKLDVEQLVQELSHWIRQHKGLSSTPIETTGNTAVTDNGAKNA